MRFDHTKWLIHFVRDRKPEQDLLLFEEYEGDLFDYNGIELDADAFSVLLNIIRLGGLLSGYSFRGGRTTIYGGKPAICATEMPIYSFSEYVRKRGKADEVSAYGIAFLKSEFYEAGGRPVIYGLTLNENVSYRENNSFSRIFNESVLPLQEQFRYVAYSPTNDKWIDWSHEREWRWVARDDDKHTVWAETNDYADFIDGLPLFNGKENNGYFSKLGIIVWNNEEATRIQEELTGYYLAQYNNYSTPFSRILLENSFIIVLNDVIKAVENDKNLEAQTIEGIQAANLLKAILICENTETYENIINKTLKEAKEAGKRAADNYLTKYPDCIDSCGFASVISYEVTNPIIQQMIKMQIGSGPFDGKVVFYIHGEWQPQQSISYEEYIAEAMCEVFNRKLGKLFYCESRLD